MTFLLAMPIENIHLHFLCRQRLMRRAERNIEDEEELRCLSHDLVNTDERATTNEESNK
jgi:hypothetical protein